MAKFKVGDKVRVIAGYAKGVVGEITRFDEKDGTFVVMSSTKQSSIGFHEKNGFGVWQSENNVELIEPRREFIVIRRSGAETIAELRHDREVIKSAKATCAPSDTFDLDTGAKLAFDRLTGREKPKPEPQPAHRFKVGDRVVHKEYGMGTIIQYISFHPDVPYFVKPDNEDCYCNHWAEENLSPAPAPEPPKFYTGKVRCIGVKGEAATEGRTEINEPFYARVGKEYKFDEGGCSALGMRAVKSFQEIERSLEFGLWIEVKE